MAVIRSVRLHSNPAISKAKVASDPRAKNEQEVKVAVKEARGDQITIYDNRINEQLNIYSKKHGSKQPFKAPKYNTFSAYDAPINDLNAQSQVIFLVAIISFDPINHKANLLGSVYNVFNLYDTPKYMSLSEYTKAINFLMADI